MMSPNYVTPAECSKHRHSGRWKLGLALGAPLVVLVSLACYLAMMADAARSTAAAVDLKVEVQRARVEEFRDSLRVRLEGIESEIKAMRADQAAYFRGRVDQARK